MRRTARVWPSRRRSFTTKDSITFARCTSQRFRNILKRKKRGLLFSLHLPTQLVVSSRDAQAVVDDDRSRRSDPSLLRVSALLEDPVALGPVGGAGRDAGHSARTEVNRDHRDGLVIRSREHEAQRHLSYERE